MSQNEKHQAKTPGGNSIDPLEQIHPWPTEEEQRAYWRRKEREAVVSDPATLLAAVDAFGVFFDDLMAATAKLKEQLKPLAECPTATTSETSGKSEPPVTRQG